MIVPIYVINLDRSPDRWAAIQKSASEAGLNIERVPAADGALLGERERAFFDVALFRRQHGRTPLPAEIGCYLSHLRVFALAETRPEEMFLVAEDDIRFGSDLIPLLSELHRMDGWDIVKLVNHRYKLFRRVWISKGGIRVGRCCFGPSGSSAAYVVRKSAIPRIREMLSPAALPYDAALERGWAGSVKVFTTNRPIVAIHWRGGGSISQQNSDKSGRPPFYRRIGALVFRMSDLVRRLSYALRPTKLEQRRD